MMKTICALLAALFCALTLTGCSCSAQGAPAPRVTPHGTHMKADAVKWPKEKLPADENGIPQLRVYVTDDKAVRTMDMETYVAEIAPSLRETARGLGFGWGKRFLLLVNECVYSIFCTS